MKMEGFIFEPGTYMLMKRSFEQMITGDRGNSIVLQLTATKP